MSKNLTILTLWVSQNKIKSGVKFAFARSRYGFIFETEYRSLRKTIRMYSTGTALYTHTVNGAEIA